MTTEHQPVDPPLPAIVGALEATDASDIMAAMATAEAPVAAPVPTPFQGGMPVFDSIGRSLTIEDLGNAAVGKLILAMLEESRARTRELEPYVDKWHTADVRARVAEEKLAKDVASERLSAAVIAIGGAMFGASFYFFPFEPWAGVVLALLGAAAMVLGFFIRRKP